MPLPARRQIGCDRVLIEVGTNESVDRRAVDSGDGVGEIVDTPGVDRHPEADLGGDLVPFGDRDIAHVVAETGEPEVAELVPTGRGAAPATDRRGHVRIVDVAEDRLAFESHPRLDEAELAVAVGGLVEVHEVHVDRRPGERSIGLGVQVEKRLAQRLQPGDPHLGGREGVHPADHPHAAIVGAGVETGSADRVGGRQHRAFDDPHRDRVGTVEGGHDLVRLVGDLTEGVVSVERLAAGEEPDLLAGEGLDGGHRDLISVRRRSGSGRTGCARRSVRSGSVGRAGVTGALCGRRLRASPRTSPRPEEWRRS